MHLKGWFTEMNDMWPGQAMSLQVEEILHHEKSQYQDILVFKRCVEGRGGKVEEEEEGWGRGWLEHFGLSITHFLAPHTQCLSKLYACFCIMASPS